MASEGGLLAAGTYGYEVADMLDDLEADDAAGVVCSSTPPAAASPDPAPSRTRSSATRSAPGRR